MNICSREEFTLCDALYAQHSPKWEEKRHPILEEWEESCIYYASEHFSKAISFSLHGCKVRLVLWPHFTDEDVGAHISKAEPG